MSERADLAEFLRSRRAAIGPADVGMPTSARRRTPGLRREEVALLAGVSVSWYTWLEQGRPVNASRDVLVALARALHLDAVETDHLLGLAGHPVAPSARGRGADLPDDLPLLLEALEPAPAYVMDDAGFILALNDAQARLFPTLTRLPAAERNLVWLVFADAEVRPMIGDWDTEARRVLSQFRAESTPNRDQPAVRDLVARLLKASPEFAAWWPRHDVAAFESRVRTFHHPVAGRLQFRFSQLVPSGRPDLRVVAHLPLPGDDSIARLSHSGHVVA